MPLRACLVLLAALFVGPTGIFAQVMDPPVIVDSYERARNQRDFDAALNYFADNAVVRLEERSGTSFTGKADIRRFLQSIQREPPQITSNRHVVGNTVTWKERVRGQAQTSVDLSVEAVVQEGKIVSLLYRIAPPAQPPAAPQADAPARVPAAAVATALVLLGGALLVAASLGSRRAASNSTLRGKLLTGLARSHSP